jgi:RelB Antitoxin alpha helical domain
VMLSFKKKYILDKNKKRVAVQMDISTYDKIVTLLEDYALGRFIKENKKEERLPVEKAKEEYEKSKAKSRKK